VTTSLAQLLDDAAAAAPDHLFLRTDAGTRTYHELAERSRRVASGLRALGLQPGDRVAVAAPNGIEWLEFFFGAVRLGLVVVTLNVRYRETELDYMLNQSQARLLLTAERAGGFDFRSFYATFRSRVPALEHIRYLDDGSGDDSFHSLQATDSDAGEDEPGSDAPAVILYTSGTTGLPKGAVLTHGSILASAAAQVDRAGTQPDDVLLGVMPLNHVGGLTCTVTAAMLGRSTVVMPAAFSPAGAIEAMAEQRVTVFAGVPTMWSLILGHPAFPTLDTSSARLAIVGGSNAEPALCRAIVAGFPSARLTNLYGLSETSGAVVLSAVDDGPDVVAQTLGTPLTGMEVRVVGPDGALVPTGEDGELQVRGPAMASGYWQLPDETAQTFLEEGWLATGDIVSADDTGHLTLRGRRKEMYLQGGYNVYPVEVENVLTQFPGVAMAAGIGVPDPVLGEVGRYYVVPREPDAAVDVDALTAFCRERLADYKVPRQVVVVPELPMTPSGKIAKSVLREQTATG
jgi:acyl-CoA synthetase (AMP-forming)/AMP-acid ligase II